MTAKGVVLSEEEKAKARARAAAYYHARKNDPAFKAKKAANTSAWARANPEKTKAWRARNKDKIVVYQRRWRKTPNGKRLWYAIIIRHLYGLEVEDVARMFEAQGGKCLGCERKLCFDSDTCIDHCHVSKVVRGLLCDDCNQILGRAKDSIETLNNLIGYLTKSQVP